MNSLFSAHQFVLEHGRVFLEQGSRWRDDSDLMRWVAQVLPQQRGASCEATIGRDRRSALAPRFLTRLADAASVQNNEL